MDFRGWIILFLVIFVVNTLIFAWWVQFKFLAYDRILGL